MRKEYFYRKHIRLISNFIPLILFILGGCSLLLGIIASFIEKDDASEILLVFSLLGVVVIIEGLLIKYFYKKFTSTSFTLTDDYIIFINNKKEITLRYEDIKSIEFPSVKYVGGWIKIHSETDNIRLTVVIENIHELLIELKKQLDKRQLNQIYNEKGFENFFKTASYSDLSWNRIYRIFFKLTLSIIIFISISILFIIFNLAGDFLPLLIVLSILIPIILYLLSEAILGAKMRKTVNNNLFEPVKNDIIYENKIYKIMFILGLIINIIIFTLVAII